MEKIPDKRKFKKTASSTELLRFDKNELVERIIQLQAHNSQLKNIISKQQTNDVSQSDKKNRPFDFSKCHFRRVLLRILYFGWDYQGLAVQEDSTQTIEHHLFYTLTKTCLIQSRETSQYHRCGRTDKGVSAFGQVISISLRSKYPEDQQEDPNKIRDELPYCKIMNRLLPKEIRVVAWMPIPKEKPEYSARFDCNRRLYKYYFPRSNLDLSAMRKACSLLVGSHDFRNLCKMDVGNGVTEFTRRIYKAEIVGLDDKDSDTSMFYLEIEGNAFLWHQIRCIVGILILIGQRNESPEVISELLDVSRNPCKPQYSMALDVPLNLYHCSYELERDREWVYDKESLRCLIKDLQSYWTLHSIKATMINDCVHSLDKEYKKVLRKETEGSGSDASERDNVTAFADCLLQGVKSKVYKPLLKRETCSSLEERVEYYKRRRRLPDLYDNGETSEITD